MGSLQTRILALTLREALPIIEKAKFIPEIIYASPFASEKQGQSKLSERVRVIRVRLTQDTAQITVVKEQQ